MTESIVLFKDMPAKTQTQQARPFFSVIILCWNSQPYLNACLQSLDAQEFKDFEIILVDNGSPKPMDVIEFAGFTSLDIRFFHLTENLGFAGGNNFAARQANGEYLVLLNSDANPQPDWLEVIHQAVLDHPASFFASRLVMAINPDHLDGEGDVYHASGLVWRRSFGKPLRHAIIKQRKVFSACGAAAIYPRKAYEQVQGFDEKYFAYVEDVDLGFRLNLAGFDCLYLPRAVVLHVGSGSTSRRSDLSVYYGQRNLVWTFAKNMPAPLVWLLLPGHLLANLLMIFLSLFRSQGSVTLRAKIDAVAGLGNILKERKKVQQTRKISIFSLMKIMDWNPFSPLTKLISR